MIYIVLLLLIFLWKFSDTYTRGWILGIGLMSIAVTVRGQTFNILTLIICIGVWKVCIDIYNAGK